MTWIVRRRCNSSVVRRTLGTLDALTVEYARVAARALLADAAVGDSAALTAPKVHSFARTFLADCAERSKPETRKTYAFNVRRWIEPAFGDRRVDAIGTKGVRSRFDGIAATHPRLGELGAGGDVVVPAAVAASPAQPVPPLADHGVWPSAKARW